MIHPVNIRFAEVDDLPAIVAILNQAIRARMIGSLDESDTEKRLAWFDTFDKNAYPIYVAEIENKIVGYCYLSPYREGRKAMRKMAEISYFVDETYQRQGIASALIKNTISDCKRLQKNTLIAILLDVNQPSISLLEKFNFELWGKFPETVDLEGTLCSQLFYGLKL